MRGKGEKREGKGREGGKRKVRTEREIEGFGGEMRLTEI